MRKTLWFSLVILLVMVLSACGSNEKSKKTTLEVALWSDSVKDALDSSIADFNEEYPDVEVKVTITPFGDYWTKLRTSLGGGSGPDVFWMNGPNFFQFASKDLIKDLQPLIDEDDSFDLDAYVPIVRDLYTYEDNLYAAPYMFDSVALFYNKDLFDEAGVDYPDETWTWEDLKKYGKELSDEEDGMYGYAGHTVISQEGYYNIIHQAGGYIISDDKTKSGFDLPETKEAFNFLASLIDEGISPSTKTQIETHPRDMFISEKIAMLPAVSTNSELLHDALGDKLAVAPLPAGKEKASIIHGISWAMNNKTENEELAWELIKYLTGEEGSKTLAESGYNMPANEQYIDLWAKSIPSLDLQVFVDAREYGVLYPISNNTAEWQSIETSDIQQAFLEGRSIEEALDSLAEEMNEILEEEQNE